MKYIIFDRISNEIINYNDEIDMGFELDNLLEHYNRYFNTKVYYYNNYKIVVIREEGEK